MSNPPSVLVLGHGPRAFLSSIRSLGRKGLAVDVNFSQFDDIAMRSSFVREKIAFPDFDQDPDAWLAFLTQLLDQKSYDLILPCNDTYVARMATHRDQIENSTPIAMASTEALEVCNSKWQSAELASKSGLPVPEGQLCDVGEPLLQFVRESEWPFPLIVKPLSSTAPNDAASQPATRRSVRRIRNGNELKAFAQAKSHWGQCIVQRNFNGRGLGVHILAHQGKVLAAIAQERLHEPLEGGGSHYRRTVPLPEHLMEGIQRFLSSVQYTGVIMFEFRKSSTKDTWTFIEVNARLWGSLALSMAAGADFPYWLYEMQCQGRRDFRSKFRLPVYCRNLTADFYWLKENLRADKSDPTLATQPVTKTIAELGNLVLGREYWDSFAWDDLRPFYHEMRDVSLQVIRKPCRKLWPRWQEKWLTPTRMQAASRGAGRLLVLCRGNICRSPYAVAVLKSKLGDHISIRQGGSFPKENRPSPEQAQLASKQQGVDLSGHRSRRYSQQDLSWADLVICFDQRNYDELLPLLGDQASKLWPLGAALPGRPPWIEDPYGRDVDDFVSTYQTIDACCTQLAEWIEPANVPSSDRAMAS